MHIGYTSYIRISLIRTCNLDVMCAGCHVESHATGLHMTWVMHY